MSGLIRHETTAFILAVHLETAFLSEAF